MCLGLATPSTKSHAEGLDFMFISACPTSKELAAFMSGARSRALIDPISRQKTYHQSDTYEYFLLPSYDGSQRTEYKNPATSCLLLLKG